MENITVEQALQVILDHTKAITETECVGLLQASGRILAQDLAASFDNPSFDRSPVDGYACRAEDLKTASREHPILLKVTEEIDAGQYSMRKVKSGQAVRIMTGAPIPPGCDCCIRQEDTDCGEETVSVYRKEEPYGNYCYRGEDFQKGQVLLKKETKIGFVETGILASMGKTEAEVFRLPRIALLTTGDEVTDPGQPLRAGRIYDSNRYLLTARLLEFGVQITESRPIADDPSAMTEAIKQAAKEADLILTTGAVSVGKKDIMHEVLKRLPAQRMFWKVKMKPGMPTLFSVYQNVPVLSMSGNPFGVAVTVELLARPLLRKMKQDDTLGLARVCGRMADTFTKVSHQRRFVRAVYRDGVFSLPDGLHSNGVLASMAGCNCLIDIPAGSMPLAKGTRAEAFLL